VSSSADVLLPPRFECVSEPQRIWSSIVASERLTLTSGCLPLRVQVESGAARVRGDQG
jgi:hypothetical protein